jgi:hypothetical protein
MPNSSFEDYTPQQLNDIRNVVSTRISEIMITNFGTLQDLYGETFTLKSRQKVVRGGLVSVGRENDYEKLLVMGEDFVDAATDSYLIDQIISTLGYPESVDQVTTDWIYFNNVLEDPKIIVVGVESYDPATDETPGEDDGGFNGIVIPFTSFEDLSQINPQNVSQFIGIQQVQDVIDLDKAKEILATKVTELIPDRKTREEQIQDFFTMYLELKGDYPKFDTNDDGIINTEDIINFSSEDYSYGHDYNSNFYSNNPFDGYIVRMRDDASEGLEFQTLQSLYEDLKKYFEDIDLQNQLSIEDSRPVYENKSNGYVKLRSLNQGIIIRKQEGDDVGIEQIVTVDGQTGPSYLVDGFTIAMWVKFKDKVNTGTLFNYGNPTRDIDPKGFKLETFVLNGDEIIASDGGGRTWKEYATEIGSPAFDDSDSARFVRLVLREGFGNDTPLRDSHMGQPWQSRINTTDQPSPEFGNSLETIMLNYTQIPIDFDEWFYIVASYNPDNDETLNYPNQPWWWLGYMVDDGGLRYTPSPSGFGSKCKVEFISKSALLRARGYAPEEK